MYISFLFTRPECSEYIIILYTVVNKQSVRDFSHIVFLWLKYCIPQCLCYNFTVWKTTCQDILQQTERTGRKKIFGIGTRNEVLSRLFTSFPVPVKTQNHNQAARLGFKVGEWLHFTSPLFGSQCWCCWSRHWCRLCWSTGTGMSWKKKGEPATIDLYKRKIRQESQDTVTIQIIFDFWSSN